MINLFTWLCWSGIASNRGRRLIQNRRCLRFIIVVACCAKETCIVILRSWSWIICHSNLFCWISWWWHRWDFRGRHNFLWNKRLWFHLHIFIIILFFADIEIYEFLFSYWLLTWQTRWCYLWRRRVTFKGSGSFIWLECRSCHYFFFFLLLLSDFQGF